MLIAMLPIMLYNQYGNNAFITLFHIAHFLVREGISNFINRQVPVAERQFITGICHFIYKYSYQIHLLLIFPLNTKSIGGIYKNRIAETLYFSYLKIYNLLNKKIYLCIYNLCFCLAYLLKYIIAFVAILTGKY